LNGRESSRFLKKAAQKLSLNGAGIFKLPMSGHEEVSLLLFL
jgi:hypothetical protein